MSDDQDQNDPGDPGNRRKWHVEKSVPLATIAMLMLQTAGVIWWAASTSARLEYLEKGNLSAQLVQTSIDNRQDQDAQRAEGRLLGELDKVNQKLDRLIETRRTP
jgi:hypothetical protein